MQLAADIAVALVALLHLGFLALEMFLWQRPMGRKVFRMSAQKAADTATLAANQGLYNGFLAAGLLWGRLAVEAGRDIQLFFLACVIVAGVYGGLTASRAILWVQALPGLLALALVLLSR